ncbi:hypothetical protein DNTS_033196 [Danionella cerebrum]|uniref:Voltage-dependent calcium channel alpha-2/delta subunit conserved region domain-containing protein n=1 Tax=Danionella cerebrum TaxID=2873325 RepID=A0A553NKU9_9TELE|nr:hypothetical protein DNTS_033196 [Danionella translucida]
MGRKNTTGGDLWSKLENNTVRGFREISCYLIDNNGYIIVAEDPTLTGMFFGEAEGAVMNKLVSMGSFQRVSLYNYRAICRVNAQTSDTAHTLLHPYFTLFSAIRWILTEIIILLVEFNLYSWWHSSLSADAHRGARPLLVPCDFESPAFISERTIKETQGSIDCQSCVKWFVIQQIPSSNLFMLVIDNFCECNNSAPVTLEPLELIYILLLNNIFRNGTCSFKLRTEGDRTHATPSITSGRLGFKDAGFGVMESVGQRFRSEWVEGQLQKTGKLHGVRRRCVFHSIGLHPLISFASGSLCVCQVIKTTSSSVSSQASIQQHLAACLFVFFAAHVVLEVMESASLTNAQQLQV